MAIVFSKNELDLITEVRTHSVIRHILAKYRITIQNRVDYKVLLKELISYSDFKVPKIELDGAVLTKVNKTLSTWAGIVTRLGNIYIQLAPLYAELNILLKRAEAYILSDSEVQKLKNIDQQKSLAYCVLEELHSFSIKLENIYDIIDRVSKDLAIARQTIQLQQESLRLGGSLIRGAT